MKHALITVTGLASIRASIWEVMSSGSVTQRSAPRGLFKRGSGGEARPAHAVGEVAVVELEIDGFVFCGCVCCDGVAEFFG